VLPRESKVDWPRGGAVASLEHDAKSGRFLARFRYAGREYKRSLRTSNPKEARGLLGRLEYTIQRIERGDLEIPPHVDSATFIVTAGKSTAEEERPEALTLKGLGSLPRRWRKRLLRVPL
jgi:hypothetical protein